LNIIILGAGQVGSTVATELAREESNEITVIDINQTILSDLQDRLDLRTICGNASYPNMLEAAGADDADMLIALTNSDEINMVACQVAHSLFDIPTKIARIRSQSYLDQEWQRLFSREHMPIDVIISPEIEVARAIARRLELPGAFDVIPLADGKVSLIGVHCTDECPVLDTPLRQLTDLFPDLHIAIVGISRGGEGIVPSGDTEMRVGDDIYFVAETGHIPRAMPAFGHEETEARRVIIVGGGNIGLYLAQIVEKEYPHVSMKLIELDKKRAEFVAQTLERTVVINGNALDTEILEEVNARTAETVVAVSNDDEVNILASMLAKRYGCRRAVTLINKNTYDPLIGTLGIETVVNPRAITVSRILEHVRRGRIRSVHTLAEGFGERIEAEALETSSLVGVPLRDAKLPDGVVLGALVRNDEIIIPRGDTVVKAGDLVILFAASEAVKKVEKLFAVKLEFF